jgi:FkbM family methyltransferase
MSAVKKLVLEMMGFPKRIPKPRLLVASEPQPAALEIVDARVDPPHQDQEQEPELLQDEPQSLSIQEIPAEPCSPPSPPPAHDVFLTPEALAINEARLCHLASLGLDLKNKRVLEVGGGIGLHTCFFESLGCDVLFTEARLDNLEEAQRRYPHRKTALINLDAETDLTRLGRFDIIYCYGTLYHLTHASNALRVLAEICDGLILLETCVTPGDHEDLHPELEPASVANQAFTGLGCRPTRSWVLNELKRHMGYAYQTTTQPNHDDFERNWIAPLSRKLYRAVFVGSKSQLNHTTLSESPCTLQTAVPACHEGIWFDVGAHLGETSFAKAQANPKLRVFALEPNISLAHETFQRLPNFQVLPIAVGERNGLSTFHLNAFAAASSLLPMDETARQEWIGGEVLRHDSQITVPMMRLDAMMHELGIHHVDFLKIDAQGGDFAVVKSLGNRLRDVRKIKLEVTTKPQQLYRGAGTKSEILDFMSQQGYVLISEQTQTHGQEENLLFFQLGPWTVDLAGESPLQSFEDELELKRALHDLPLDQLVEVAKRNAGESQMTRVPGWSFGSYATNPTLASRFRRILGEVFQERKISIPILFHWYDSLKLWLHLGNDISLPTYVSGVIDPNEFCFLDSFLQKGMTVVDIGANEGFYSVFAADRVGNQGRVIAFEPSEREANRLAQNVELNAATNVTIETWAIADCDGHAILKLCEYGHEGQNTLGDFAHPVLQEGTQPVRLMALDSYFVVHPTERIDLMKLDVEGSEERVLRGAQKTLAQFRPVLLIEMNDRSLQWQGSSCRDIAQFLRSIDYCIYCFEPSTGGLLPARGDFFSENVVAVPGEKIAWIQQCTETICL